MIFKKIEMVGFKSFADRTVIEFGDNFTAIVGPNGCGKSNVSDAIRWVLGEQSAKSLRGDNMQDVIFSGTEKRRSLSYCEVTLTFDNSSRFFDFDYDELAITRKLYRSGESEYLINRNTCHLRDITNLLYNSGLGKNGYSLVSQGKVTELVDSKPENRRAMFEDAAGIAKYKNDKSEAERKLARTRDNLTRVSDILTELERQMGPLKKQAENAKKYLEYKDSLKDLEVNAYIYQFENASDAKAKIGVRLRAVGEELSQRQAELEKANDDYSKAMQASENFDKSLASINNEILQLTVALEKQEGESRLTRERINFTQKENDRLHLDLSASTQVIESAQKALDDATSEGKKLEEQLQILEKTFDELASSYSNLASQLVVSEDEAGASQQKLIDTLGSLSDTKANVSRLAAQENILEESLENLRVDIKALAQKAREAEQVCKAGQDVVSSTEEKLALIKKKAEQSASTVYLEQQNINSLQNERANLVTQIKVCENRKKLLEELQTEYEGYAFSVKKLLKESEKNAVIRSKIVGVVASLIKVPEKFETAIEVALGGAVQNIVTYDEEGAKALIAFLKNNQYGRATFLPISTMKRRDIDKNLYVGKSGVFGSAAALVSFDKQIEPVVSNLLGATVIVETLDDAVALARSSRYAFRIVTLEGDVVNPQGSLTGGSKKAESSNLMGRNREIERLAGEIKTSSARQAEISTILTEKIATFEEAKRALEELKTEQSECEVLLAKEKEKLAMVTRSRAEAEDNLSATSKEAETVEGKIKLIKSERARFEKVESALSGNKDDADELAREQKARFENLRKERDAINDNLSGVKAQLAAVKAKLESVNDEKLRLEGEVSKQKIASQQTRDAIAKNDEFIASAEELIKQQIASAPTSETKTKLDNLASRRDKISQEKTEIADQIRALDSKKATYQEEISRLNDRKFREEMNLSKVDTELEQMQERIYEEYSLTYESCLDLRRPNFDIAVAMPEIGKLKKDISALGYVNVNAIEDCKVLLTRYDDLSAQSADLTKAEDDLNKIIKDLSDIMVEKFMNELNRINESFKLTFRELFGGGTARLALSDEENPLESGVEIFAQPPGKKIQNMTLLSGGEKSLTAMAAIFAILRIKPLPFCLFDEVEAALDDSNVEIVDKYLKKLSGETQFILITHKKPTMEYANELFGVTMEEKGVSKVVSVKLSEAIKHAQEG